MLVFLDIDGVMVPAKGWKSPDFLEDGFPAFSSKATSALQSLVSKDDVTVMLTTSHKSNYSVDEWKNIFKNRGINISHLETLPANNANHNRKDEIIDWLAHNLNDESFIIIDDDNSLNSLSGSLRERLIQTSPYIGLTEEHLSMIYSILQKDSQPR